MIAALFSGGKDSTLAIHRAKALGKEVELLITMVSENDFSYMFHKPNINLTELQAEALGMKRAVYHTKGEKEKELADIELSLKENNVTELVTGAVASSYQKDRIGAICKRLSINAISPLWRIDPMEELEELSGNYDVIITQVAAEGFDESMLGSRIDAALIERLRSINARYRTSMLFEGGEAESLVLDAPMFRKRISIGKSHIERDGSVSRYVVDSAVLTDK